MTPLLPGQAAVTFHEGQVCYVVCDEWEESDGTFEGRSDMYLVPINGLHVPVVCAVMRIMLGD